LILICSTEKTFKIDSDSRVRLLTEFSNSKQQEHNIIKTKNHNKTKLLRFCCDFVVVCFDFVLILFWFFSEKWITLFRDVLYNFLQKLSVIYEYMVVAHDKSRLLNNKNLFFTKDAFIIKKYLTKNVFKNKYVKRLLNNTYMVRNTDVFFILFKYESHILLKVFKNF